jgi:hypothetical protein
MCERAPFPFADDTEWLLRHCKLPLHAGVGNVDRHGNAVDPLARMISKTRQAMGQANLEHTEPQFEASFLVPATGNCLVFLRWPGKGRLSQNVGEGLTVIGNSPEGPFRLTCPQYYIKTTSPMRERPAWAVARPLNQPATVSYGDARPVASVTAIINNFDFDYGNQDDSNGQERGEVLRVEAAGRTVDFVWRSGRVHLRRLSRSTKCFAHSNRIDHLLLILLVFQPVAGLGRIPTTPDGSIGERLSSIGPTFAAFFCRFRAALGIAP